MGWAHHPFDPKFSTRDTPTSDLGILGLNCTIFPGILKISHHPLSFSSFSSISAVKISINPLIFLVITTGLLWTVQLSSRILLITNKGLTPLVFTSKPLLFNSVCPQFHGITIKGLIITNYVAESVSINTFVNVDNSHMLITYSLRNCD